ncbi:MAG: rRNA maturation RNase YbeY [Candidatus Moranbacteria bacterium]|nr:rRNA maturation RNase YbeY [Candidatus Moranbacteria bacterium]
MKLTVEINNTDKSPVKKAFIKKVVARTLEKSGYLELAKKRLNLSLAWVSEVEIKKINKQYRKKDKATDVLSFCEFEDAGRLKKSSESDLFLGELILCYNYIKESAQDCTSETELQKELAKIIAHGVLHLLGFSHGKKMFAIQDEVASAFVPPRRDYGMTKKNFNFFYKTKK